MLLKAHQRQHVDCGLERRYRPQLGRLGNTRITHNYTKSNCVPLYFQRSFLVALSSVVSSTSSRCVLRLLRLSESRLGNDLLKRLPVMSRSRHGPIKILLYICPGGHRIQICILFHTFQKSLPQQLITHTHTPTRTQCKFIELNIWDPTGEDIYLAVQHHFDGCWALQW